jgi:hypothetical protein
MRRVIRATASILARQPRPIADDYSAASINDGGAPLLANAEVEGSINVDHVAGTINTEEVFRFKRLIFRATRGNAITHFQEFPRPIYDYYDNPMQKSVYVVLF